MVSFHPSDSHKVSPALALKIARESLQNVAPGQRPVLFAVHGDTEHLHVHMLYATVNETGRIHNPHRDYRIWEAVMENMEVKYDLFRVQKRIACAEGDSARLPCGTNPAKSEYRMGDRVGSPSCKQMLRKRLDSILAECERASPELKLRAFIRGLNDNRIKISVHTQTTDRMLGIRFHYGIFENKGIKGSDLGRKYAWSSLSQQIGCMDHPEHIQQLKTVDKRIVDWIKSPTGGKQWAKSQAQQSMRKNISSEQGRVTSSTRSSVGSGGFGPEIPDYYPVWLRRYIRSIMAEASAELQRVLTQQEANLRDSINVAFDLLNSIFKGRQRRCLEMKRKGVEPGW